MNRAIRVSLLTAMFLTMASAAAVRNVFSGEIQRVTSELISVRLDDGRIILARNVATHGDLSPLALAGRYTIGDRVEITCTAGKFTYCPSIRHSIALELKKLRFLREPSREERLKALTSPEWRSFCWPDNGSGRATPCNLLPPIRRSQQTRAGGERPSPQLSKVRTAPSTAPAPPPAKPVVQLDAASAARLERIRSRILESTSRMPNFVADEVARRYSSATNPPNWRLLDTIESEITIKGSAESREHMTVNGKPWDHPFEMLGGSHMGRGAFGEELGNIFNRNCQVTFEFGGRVSEGGKSLSVVRFSSLPDNGCFSIFSGSERSYPERTGRVLLDEREENVLGLEVSWQGFPKAFPMAAGEERISWGYVKAGDENRLLPVSSDVVTVNSTGFMYLNRQEYKNHRHFEASSSVKFE